MSAKKVSKQKEIERLADCLVRLVYLLRNDGPASDWQWWGKQSPRSIFKPPHPYQDGLPIFDTLVQNVLKLNSQMLSKYEVERKLAYEFLEPQTIRIHESEHLKNESLMNEAKKHLNELTEFENWQNIDIPIVNLQLEGDPVKIGLVTFETVAEQELVKWKDKPVLWPPTTYDICLFARVRAPGDLQAALSFARTQIDQVLNVLRAFCFLFGKRQETLQIGMLSSTTLTAAIPMRINNRQYVAQFSTQSGLGPALIELRKNILSKVEQSQWDSISKILQKGNRTQMESKLVNALQWLGEATKQDRNDAKFAKICFALETMIVENPKTRT